MSGFFNTGAPGTLTNLVAGFVSGVFNTGSFVSGVFNLLDSDPRDAGIPVGPGLSRTGFACITVRLRGRFG